MDQSPFSKRVVFGGSGPNRRRSTRVEFVVTVILTGREASGQPFREETQTSTVNLHGAKIRTRHQVLVGSQLVVENPRNGMSEKAICVHVGERLPGQDAVDIALQLLKPRNVWGVEKPPADWGAAEEGELRGQTAASQPAASAVSKFPPPATLSSVAGKSPRAVATPPPADSRIAGMQREPVQLVDSLLQKLRQQADAIVGEAIQKFEQRLEAAAAEAETRIVHRAEKVYAELNSAFETLSAEVAGNLAAWAQQAADTAEEALRSKIMEAFSRARQAFSERSSGETTEVQSKKR